MNLPVPNPLLEAALSLAARGWPVFPCDPAADPPGTKAKHRRAKAPLLPKESGPGAKDGGLWLATCRPEQIRAWWKRWPRALIGVRMGRDAGLFVVDLDPKSHDAATMLRGLTEFCGGVLPPCPVVRTQSGGLHLYFRYPDGLPLPPEPGYLGNRGGLFAKVDAAPDSIREHVDVRGDGGYVIVPPSVLSDGNAYTWEQEFDGEVPEAPGRLLDAILRRGEFARGAAAPSERAPSAPIARAGDIADEAVRKYALSALDREIAELSACPPGRRGQELNARAFALGQLVGAGALSQSMAEGGLREASQRNGLTATDGAARVDDTIARGLAAGARSPRDLSDIQRKARERAERWGSRRQGAALAPPDDGRFDIPAGAYAAEPLPGPQPRDADDEPDSTLDDLGDEPSDGHVGDEPPEDLQAKVRACAPLDHSDTDNARRLITHFGEDLVVLETEGVVNTDYFVWDGRVWDMAGGNDAAVRVAKRIGGLIALEADHLTSTPAERRAIEDAGQAARDLASLEARRPEWGDEEKAKARRLEGAIEEGAQARAALDKRKVARRKFGISSKNKARIVAMKDLAACEITRKPSAFDADPLRLACATHTLRFTRTVDCECPDPDLIRFIADCEATAGHRRDDLITKLLPVAYDPEAGCPKFAAFLGRFLPKDAVRRFVQVGAGLGLLGLPVQKVFFHYGNGANGKSVFLEVLVRVLGALAASLPTEAIIGTGERQGGQASPELARLFNVRFARILELPADEPLKEAVVKKLTGGEAIPVRNLFKGYFDFQPVFIAHMSGNGYPKITGTDNGIWRRIAVIHWPVTLEEHEQRDFEEVVSELVAEAPGILNWLIEGAKTYLREGLVTPPEVKAATQEYRDEMDKISPFIAACVAPAEGEHVKARVMYEAYVSWAKANGVQHVFETRFGREAKKKLAHGEVGNLKAYLNCRLQNVPERPDAPPAPARNPEGQWEPVP